MPYPSSFYYTKKQENVSYSHKPGVILNPERLINKQAPWKQLNLSSDLQKKSLIIAAVPPGKENYQKTAFQQWIKKLIEDGFSVYLWQNYREVSNQSIGFNDNFIIQPTVLPLTLENLACLNNSRTLEQVSSAPKELILNTAITEHPLAKDDTLIIDSDILKNFLNLKKLKSLHIDHSFEIINPHLEDIDSLEIINPLNGLRINLHSLQNTHQLKSLLLSSGHRLVDNTPVIENLSCSSIEDITIETKNINDLGILLKKSPQVKNILFVFHGTAPGTLLNPLALKLLKSLCWIGPFSLENLNCVLRDSSELEELSITGMIEKNFLPNTPFPRFLHLHTLSLRLENLSSSELLNLLLLVENAPNLQCLDLSGQGCAEVIHLKLKLPHLKKLTLSHLETLHFQDLQALTENSQLTSLSLYRNVTSDFLKLRLPHLEELDLSSCQNITSEDIALFLKNHPNLKKLCLPKKGKFHFNDTFELPHLKFFNCCGATIANLDTCLASATQLECLNLSNVSFPDSFILPSLSKLTVMELQGSNVTTYQFKQFLRAAPNIKYLDISNLDLTIDNELKHLLVSIEQLIENNGPVSPASSGKYRFDADTNFNPTKKFHVQQIFSPVSKQKPTRSIPSYRLDIYNEVKLEDKPCPVHQAFELGRSDARDLEDIDCKTMVNEEELFQEANNLCQAHPSFEYHFGKKKLQLTNDWQALPSLSPRDKVSHYSTSPPVKLEFKYSPRDNLYYVKGNGKRQVTVTWLTQIPPAQEPKALPEKVTQLLAKVRSFGVGELDMSAFPNPTGKDYLSALLTQKKGSCRHRALAFKAQMEELARTSSDCKLPVRVITNECHAFVEIKQGNQWHTYDLGGYAARLVINTSTAPFMNEGTDLKMETFLPHKPINPQYAAFFETWEKDKPDISGVLEYCQHLSQPREDNKKQLLELSSQEDVEALQLSLQAYARDTNRPVFYVNSPEALVCSASFIKKEGNIGVVKAPPGGALYDFLETNKKSNPLIVVNYSQFDKDDLVRFNSLLDKKTQIDGVEFHDDLQIIGLMNTAQADCYTGADFYSRFDKVERCPLSGKRLQEQRDKLAPMRIEEKPQSTPVTVIDLYQSADWKERLFGQWNIQGNELTFLPGDYEKALQKGLPIEIHHAPLELPEFQQVWRQAQLDGRFSENTPVLIKDSPYAWESLRNVISEVDNIPAPDAFLLNPYTFPHLFKQFSLKETQLMTLPGAIAAQANKTLSVYLTQALSDKEWARCLDECQTHHVHLNIHCAPTVTLPTVLGLSHVPKEITLNPWTHQSSTQDRVITSTECDTTLQSLKQLHPEALVIDVSELEPDGLLTHFHGSFKEARFEFTQEDQALHRLLNEKEHVILTGTFSPALTDALSAFLLQRQQTSPEKRKGQLTLLTKTPQVTVLPNEYHDVTLEEKKASLVDLFSKKTVARIDEDTLKQNSFSSLKASLAYLKHAPWATDSQANWQGLMGIKGGVKLPPFNPNENSSTITNQVNQTRLNAVNGVLGHSPYVFIAGLTGVGKSTFVEKYLKNKQTDLYNGVSQLKAWALASTKKDQRAILFIDEANLSPRQWTEFEGLFHHPKGILIEGKYYPLSEHHQVIFAGNPVNYGDERHLASLFARHGKAIIFDPLPPSYLFETLIKPVFANTPLARDDKALAKPLLDVYQFLCEASSDKVLISPREVQMMALLLASYQNSQDRLTPEERVNAAKHFAYQIGFPLVPQALQEKFQAFKPKEPLQQQALTKPPKFLITPSREPLYQQLNQLLNLRTYRQQAKNPASRYGGLGGMVIEGEPGIGKSELVMATLQAQGYRKVSLEHQGLEELPENPFYHIPVSLEITQKKEYLLKAFHQGAVVVIDEINSSPMLENLMNDLLMGYTPEKNRPQKPGFLVIGTQNPPTMAGRRRFSNALERRLISTYLPPYPSHELTTLLLHKQVPENNVQEIVEAYTYQVEFAQQNNLTPPPTLRHLLKLVKQLFPKKEPKSLKAALPLSNNNKPIPTPDITNDSQETTSPPPPASDNKAPTKTQSNHGFFTQQEIKLIKKYIDNLKKELDSSPHKQIKNHKLRALEELLGDSAGKTNREEFIKHIENKYPNMRQGLFSSQTRFFKSRVDDLLDALLGKRKLPPEPSSRSKGNIKRP